MALAEKVVQMEKSVQVVREEKVPREIENLRRKRNLN